VAFSLWAPAAASALGRSRPTNTGDPSFPNVRVAAMRPAVFGRDGLRRLNPRVGPPTVATYTTLGEYRLFGFFEPSGLTYVQSSGRIVRRRPPAAGPTMNRRRGTPGDVFLRLGDGVNTTAARSAFRAPPRTTDRSTKSTIALVARSSCPRSAALPSTSKGNRSR